MGSQCPRNLSRGTTVAAVNQTGGRFWRAYCRFSDPSMERLAGGPRHGAALLRGINERGLSTPALDREAILIHPGSGSPHKNWPAERFLELAGQFKRSGLPVRFILGEVESERWPAEKIAMFAEAGEILRPPRLVDLLAGCSRAHLFIGNDSGPAHLAGILGIPTIALFGPMSPRRWKPLGPRVQAIDGPLEEISVKDVLDAASALKVER